jgi:hypothetical protein
VTKEDDQYLKLGREIARMISDVLCTPPNDAAYARREITFPGGAVYLILVKTKEQAERFDRLMASEYQVDELKASNRKPGIIGSLFSDLRSSQTIDTGDA